MSGDRCHLENFQQRLSKIIRQIPLGVRQEEIEQTLQTHNAAELQNYINDSVISKLDTVFMPGFDKIWAHYKVPEKMTYLKQLEDKSPKEPAWRPTTGQANGNVVIMESLKKRKEKLQYEIASTKEKSEELKTHLLNGCYQAQKQIKEIEAAIEHFID